MFVRQRAAPQSMLAAGAARPVEEPVAQRLGSGPKADGPQCERVSGVCVAKSLRRSNESAPKQRFHLPCHQSDINTQWFRNRPVVGLQDSVPKVMVRAVDAVRAARSACP
jgi:hypothetical protein